MTQFSIKNDMAYLKLIHSSTLDAEFADSTAADVNRIFKRNPDLFDKSYTSLEEVKKDLRFVLGPMALRSSTLYRRIENFFQNVSQVISSNTHQEDRIYELKSPAQEASLNSARYLYFDYKKGSTSADWIDEGVSYVYNGLNARSADYDPKLQGRELPYLFDPAEKRVLEGYVNTTQKSDPQVVDRVVNFLEVAFAKNYNSSDATKMVGVFKNDLEGWTKIVSTQDKKDIGTFLEWTAEVKRVHPHKFKELMEGDCQKVWDAHQKILFWTSKMERPTSVSTDQWLNVLDRIEWAKNNLDANSSASYINLTETIAGNLSDDFRCWFVAISPQAFHQLQQLQGHFSLEDLSRVARSGYLPELEGLKLKDTVTILKQCLDPRFEAAQKKKFDQFVDSPEGNGYSEKYKSYHGTVLKITTMFKDVSDFKNKSLHTSDIFSVMMIESGGNAAAHNPNGNYENTDGYHGLMQLGENEFNACNSVRMTGTQSIYSPYANLYAGTNYLGKCLANKNNPNKSWALAIANYNWGSGHVSSYQKPGSTKTMPKITTDYIAAFLLYRTWFSRSNVAQYT